MATTDQMSEMTAPAAGASPELLVLLTAMPQEQLESVLANLTDSLPVESLLVAAPEAVSKTAYPALRIVAAPPASASWTLTAADFVSAYQAADKNKARALLMLGPQSASLGSAGLRALSNAVLTTATDLSVPCYDLTPNAGLINSAILYPLSRALFASRVRFPLATELGLSLRMAERLAGAAQRLVTVDQGETPLWPINEASVAGFAVGQFDGGPHVQEVNPGLDLNTVLPTVTGALFSDIDAKAAFWQRPRQLPPARDPLPQSRPSDGAVDITPMVQSFRLAYTNLYELWSLVLPPNSLFGLKRLFATDAAQFRMPDSLWVRVVYDFLLAYRLRTINRGHLLGALIPLYLAWVASHINVAASGVSPESHIEAVAAAFEADKPYLVARWRWPDRFNP